MADFDNRLSERGSLMEPIIWLGVLAVLLVIEGLTTALTTIWFAGGALAAAIAEKTQRKQMWKVFLEKRLS